MCPSRLRAEGGLHFHSCNNEAKHLFLRRDSESQVFHVVVVALYIN